MSDPLARLTPRIAAQQAQSRKRALRITALVGALGLILGCAGIVWFSPLFSARSVQVSGLTTLASEQVVAVAAVPLGTPLARLETDAIIARVKTIPQVNDVTVVRYINGVVEVRVVERLPAYVLAVDGGYQLVDHSGLAYLSIDSAPENLAVVRVKDNSERMLKDAATIVSSLPSRVTTQSFSMNADTPDSFTIHLAEGDIIMWGSAAESDLKSQVLAPLLNLDATYYDVSSPRHPATR